MISTPDFGPTIEPLAPVELASTCDSTEKPGVQLFRSFAMSEFGARDVGITRPCDVGKASEHHEGRAVDLGFDVNVPSEKANAEAMLDWLLQPDQYGNEHAMWRRAGVMYAIWNGQIFSNSFGVWRPYTGASPHTDHVHVSFSWPGARGETSLYDWLRGGKLPPPGPGPGPGLTASTTSWVGPAAFFAAAAIGFFGVRAMRG